VSICAWFLKCQFGSLLQTRKKNRFRIKLDFFSSLNLIFTAYVAYKNQFRNQIDFLTWYFEIEKKLSDTRYFKNQVEIDRGVLLFVCISAGLVWLCHHLTFWSAAYWPIKMSTLPCSHVRCKMPLYFLGFILALLDSLAICLFTRYNNFLWAMLIFGQKIIKFCIPHLEIA